MKTCPCCSGKEFFDCCAKFINDQQLPQTPEELMRSRYTAYTQANMDYIANTMKSPAADHFNASEAKEWAQQVEWNKLEVVRSSISGNKGFVEFLAQFTENGNQQILHERSEFHKINDKWFYVDGERTPLPVRKLQQVGRNDACPCGSDKKYKKCCGK